MRIVWQLFVTAMILATAAAPSRAQSRGSAELGLDGGIVYDAPSHIGGIATVGVPMNGVRIGFGITDQVNVEGSLAFDLVALKQDGYDVNNPFAPPGYTAHVDAVDLTSHAGRVGISLGLSATSPGRPFLRLGPVVRFARPLDGTARGQAGVEGAAGVKLRTGRLWAVRGELGLARFFETGSLDTSWQSYLRVGFSFFTRQ